MWAGVLVGNAEIGSLEYHGSGLQCGIAVLEMMGLPATASGWPVPGFVAVQDETMALERVK